MFSVLISLANSFTRLRQEGHHPGQKVSIVRVPQIKMGIDIGHIALIITNTDGTESSIGFYPQNFTSGNFLIFSPQDAVAVTPDPLLKIASRNTLLTNRIKVIFSTELNDKQADLLNILTQSVGTRGSTRENTKIIPLNETYTAIPLFFNGLNCASWVSLNFPAVKCRFGFPNLCAAEDPKTKIKY